MDENRSRTVSLVKLHLLIWGEYRLKMDMEKTLHIEGLLHIQVWMYKDAAGLLTLAV